MCRLSTVARPSLFSISRRINTPLFDDSVPPSNVAVIVFPLTGDRPCRNSVVSVTVSGAFLLVAYDHVSNVGFNTPEDRFQHRAAGPHLVSQGRQAQRHAFLGIAFGLAVERLMLPELLEQDHRQQTGASPAPGDHMERRRSLANLLAVPAGELLADMLDHLPLARDRFQRLGGGRTIHTK